SKDSVAFFDADGKFIKSWGEKFAPGAHGMTLHKEGEIEFLYLAPTSLHKIYKTTIDGEIVWEKDAPPLKEVYPDPGKYVPTNIRLQYFSLEGQHLKFVTNDLRYPCHFRLRGTDMLIPDLHGRVTIFDKDNKLIAHLGDGAYDGEWKQPEHYPNLPHDKRVPS